uniref:Uncharacterized protein n=1 Tax=Rhizophora mucronata TaxID=61149 RepID=A0A2P2N9V4_RHIMU
MTPSISLLVYFLCLLLSNLHLNIIRAPSFLIYKQHAVF